MVAPTHAYQAVDWNNMGNFSSFLGGGNLGNAGTAFGNMFRESAGQPLRAYTV